MAGGAGTIQQYLQAGLISELHIVISRVLLGGGVRLSAATGREQARLNY